MKVFLRFIVGSAVLFLAACGTSLDSYPTLTNQGILALDTNNPYMGINLFLAEELQKSTYLYNFFKNRGAPTAVEIIEQGSSPPHMILYYPGQREAYAADLFERQMPDESLSREWIVRGPFSIEREDFRSLTRLDSSLHGEPVFMLSGKPFRFRFQFDEKKREAALKPPLPDYLPPAPTPRPAVKKSTKVIVAKKSEAPHEEPKQTPEPINFKNLSSDQRALLIAKGFAPRADNGDILHIVKSEQEKLDEIVSWYTGSLAGKDEVLRASGLTPDQELKPGTQIRIPQALVKELKAMGR